MGMVLSWILQNKEILGMSCWRLVLSLYCKSSLSSDNKESEDLPSAPASSNGSSLCSEMSSLRSVLVAQPPFTVEESEVDILSERPTALLDGDSSLLNPAKQGDSCSAC
ncbi:hypothetical protein SLA2020_296270 [Shorea laevis]